MDAPVNFRLHSEAKELVTSLNLTLEVKEIVTNGIDEVETCNELWKLVSAAENYEGKMKLKMYWKQF